MNHPGGRSKYARIERERRFVLHSLPPGIAADTPYRAIYDRYIRRTHFRLRRAVAGNSGAITLKLTQKYAPTAHDFRRVTITNTYLTQPEYDVFAQLAADPLWKDRYRWVVDSAVFAIDVFRGSLHGLILAEIEFASEQDLVAFGHPPFECAEVTDDVLFTGGSLCRSTIADLRPVIEQRYGLPLGSSA